MPETTFLRRLGSLRLLSLSAVLFAGCLTISQPSPQIRDYRLEYPPPAIEGSPLPVVIMIPTLSVGAAYDRESIVYRPDEVSIGRYFYHRWSSNPGSLSADMLKRDFTRSGLYRAVQSGGTPLVPHYQLLGDIEEIEERVLPGGNCTAHLAMRFELVRLRASEGDPILLRQTFDEEEPCPCEDPRALSTAMSKVLARVSETLQQAVYNAISADPQA
jgi:ABC-type uncharacterized transport system auxiliary subunit